MERFKTCTQWSNRHEIKAGAWPKVLERSICKMSKEPENNQWASLPVRLECCDSQRLLVKHGFLDGQTTTHEIHGVCTTLHESLKILFLAFCEFQPELSRSFVSIGLHLFYQIQKRNSISMTSYSPFESKTYRLRLKKSDGLPSLSFVGAQKYRKCGLFSVPQVVRLGLGRKRESQAERILIRTNSDVRCPVFGDFFFFFW